MKKKSDEKKIKNLKYEFAQEMGISHLNNADKDKNNSK